MKKILIIFLVAFIMIQFFPIDKNNPPVNADMDFLRIKNTPEPMAKLIRNSCYDCHSNETKYPFYSNIQPFGWFLKNHIDEGRMVLNFSTFATYEKKRQAHKLDEVTEMLDHKAMPLESYLIAHPEAKLTDQQRKDLTLYFQSVQKNIENNITL